uniref:Uncharacterized protein n=1 Tax=Arundo donax TaxID=35708 RepID=A0A0A9D4I7_ARUDO
MTHIVDMKSVALEAQSLVIYHYVLPVKVLHQRKEHVGVNAFHHRGAMIGLVAGVLSTLLIKISLQLMRRITDSEPDWRWLSQLFLS